MTKRMFKDGFSELLFKQAISENIGARYAHLPSDEELAKTVTFSERHERRMHRLFAKEKRAETLKDFSRRAKRAVAVAAIVFAALSAMLLTSPEVRAAVEKTIVQWYSQFTQFVGGTSGQTGINWELSALPEGYALQSEDPNAGLVIYSNSENRMLILTYVTADNSIAVNNEGVIYSQIIDSGTIYHVFAATNANEYSTLVWDKDGYRFSIDGF